MSLEQLTERVYIYRGAVNFGLVKAPQRRLILVDSGLDSGNARKAIRPFLEDGYRLTSIINTHSHSDHIGGNADLVRRTGCTVLAPARERPFILWPELEPMGLYGGTAVPPALQVKFLQAQPTPEVAELPSAPGHLELDGVDLELVPVPGHAWDQVAISCDGVLLAADSLFMPDLIARHPIIFLVDVGRYLEGLQRLSERPERWILPGHGDLIRRETGEEDPLPAIIETNRNCLLSLQTRILDALQSPLSLDELVWEVGSGFGKRYDNEPQYFLDRAAISAHLSYLSHRDQVQVEYLDGRRLLKRTMAG